ncbi:hypothetical protein DMP07_01445 [Slackia faecicanis]|uniref:Metal ABC transporter substrate-binding protein n=1 Tax=Slackia faecicanis TaxID=255723 RepID=A0A3N0AI80_9ACTN|nr:MetQ/NlpA family ABC transporter substrate-binding protein [Slackia faecicanis]RNL21530.1 hypothetical protein DMP07_01445 [Slackia faecicanis]
MKFKKFILSCAGFAAAFALAFSLAGCGGAAKQVAVPSDATNEARALLLLEDQGLITLAEGAGLAATKNDIVENPYGIEIVETEAASLPRVTADVDAAVINGNYAIGAGLDPATAFASEDAASAAADKFANVIVVRAGDEGSVKTAALLAALQSDEVQEFIAAAYSGAVTAVFEPGAAGDIPQAEGDDVVIKVGASPAPHAEILAQVKDVLAAKGWVLEVVEFTDYVQPNVALSEGDLDANYFQHQPYLDDYNAQNGTDLAGVAKIHFEPLSVYPGKSASVEALKQ